MKKFQTAIITIIFCCVSSLCHAQKITASVSDEGVSNIIWDNMVKIGDKAIRYEFTGRNKLTSFNRNIGVDLFLYDSMMNEIKKISLSDGQRLYNVEACRIIKINEKAYFIYQQILDKKKSEDLLAIEIDPKTLLAGTPKIISTISNTDPKLRFLKMITLGNDCFTISVSSDKKRVSILTAGNEYKIFASILDGSLNIISEKVVDINSEKHNYFESTCIDDKGNIYLSYRIYPQKKVLKHIRAYDKNWQVYDYTIDLGEATAQKMIILPSTKKDLLHFAGYYNHSKDVDKFDGRLEGTFVGNIDLTKNKLSSINIVPLPDSVLQLLENDGWATTGGKNSGLYYEFYPQLYEVANGSLNMVSQFVYTKMMANSPFKQYGDMLNVHFDSSGINYTRVPKFKSGVSDFGSYFIAATYNDNMVLLYNDYTDNLEQDIKLKPKGSGDQNNIVLVAAIIGLDGTFRRNVIIDMKENYYLAIVENNIKLALDKFFMPLQKFKVADKTGKKLRWATIDFK